MEEYLEIAKRIIELRTTKNHPILMQEGLKVCKDYFSGLPVFFKDYEHEGVKSLLILNVDTLSPEVLMLGHIDVADGDDELFKFKIEGDRLYGRGTSDMKAFVASNLYVMKQLLVDGYKGSIGCLIVTDEEDGGFNGTRYMVDEIGLRPKIVLVPDDGDNINTIVTASKYILSIKFNAKGISAHGNRPWDGINALDLLLETYQNLKKNFSIYENGRKPEDNWINTINLGVMKGGYAANEVPAIATMNIDIRLVPSTTKEEMIDLIIKSLVTNVDFEIVAEAKPTIVDTNDKNFLRYCSLIKEKTNNEVLYKRSGGGTDARYFSNSGTTIIIHQGDCGDAQGENEYVNLKSIKQLTDIQMEFIKSIN